MSISSTKTSSRCVKAPNLPIVFRSCIFGRFHDLEIIAFIFYWLECKTIPIMKSHIPTPRSLGWNTLNSPKGSSVNVWYSIKVLCRLYNNIISFFSFPIETVNVSSFFSKIKGFFYLLLYLFGGGGTPWSERR
jgi:hypothetical protein